MPFTVSGVLIDVGDGTLIPIQPAVSNPATPGIGTVIEPPPATTAPPSPPPTPPPTAAVTTAQPPPSTKAPEQPAATAPTTAPGASTDGDAVVPPGVRVPQGYLGYYSQNVTLTTAPAVTGEPTTSDTPQSTDGATTPASTTPPAGAAMNPTQPVASSTDLLDAPTDAIVLGSATLHQGYFGNVTEIRVSPFQSGPTTTPPQPPTPPAAPSTPASGPIPQSGGGRSKRLLADIGPGTDPIPSDDFGGYGDLIQDALDPEETLGKKLRPGQQEIAEAYAERRWRNFLKEHWQSPVQPSRAQGIEFYNLWEQLVKANVDDKEAVMLRRAYAIEKDIDSAPPGPRRDRLLGAVAAISLLLTLETRNRVYGPSYLRYGGEPIYPSADLL
jgi:hypothetical protein